jgi:formylglycine-generating enzyme required for sulfatase activity
MVLNTQPELDWLGIEAMRMPLTLMMAIGKAAVNLAGAGHISDALEIAKAVWDLWEGSPQERIDELEAVVQAHDDEVKLAIEQVVSELAGGEPAPVRMKLATFLTHVPARIRQSQRRPADPSGRTIRRGLVLSRPEDLVPFIPDQLPRFQPGDRPLGGVDWVLVELLGIGGFGEVWKAKHAHFDAFHPVALKFCTDLQARERLLKHEAKVCARVMRQGPHPGIVSLKATYLSADPPCLEYEYVEGGDLGGLILDWHRQAEKPSPQQVAGAMLQIAETVAFAHRLDPPIVHRDLKPANILVQRSRGGEIEFRVTDFGIGGIAVARAIQANRLPTSPSQFLTEAMRGSGTTLYASPEQLRPDHDPDPRDDVHALGVIWYQMLTGDLTRGRPGGTAWRRRFLGQGMSAAMLDLLESCFEDEADRPADAAFLAKELRTLLKPAPRPDPIVVPPPQKHVVPPPQKDVVNSIGMKLKLIPAGEFRMGSTEYDSEKPIHLVTISRPFYLGVCPVTQGEYMQLIKKNPSHFSGNDRLPVENVSWFEAVAFCNELSRKEGLKPFYTINGESVEAADWNGPGYRLPTEAEWEYACRAGKPTRFSFGDDEKLLGEHAWYNENSGNQTHPVGAKKPNPFGLYDVHGNVGEWCWDWFDASYYNNESSHIDPKGPKTGKLRVLRGGSWYYLAFNLHSAYRYGLAPAERDQFYGFRLARTYY